MTDRETDRETDIATITRFRWWNMCRTGRGSFWSWT